jgi:hypothetical protein
MSSDDQPTKNAFAPPPVVDDAFERQAQHEQRADDAGEGEAGEDVPVRPRPRDRAVHDHVRAAEDAQRDAGAHIAQPELDLRRISLRGYHGALIGRASRFASPGASTLRRYTE